MIYFDHNATTPLDERVCEAMLPFLTTFYGNPSGLYRQGRIVRSAIDTAREQIASLVDASASQVLFTSGGTESNNMALNALPSKGRLVISSIEHPSITDYANYLATKDAQLNRINVDSQGAILWPEIKIIQDNPPDLISIMLANNETGVIQDIKRISESIDPKNLILHTDAVQAVGKIPVSFKQLGVDLLSISSHKIYGPKGSGALIYKNIGHLKPLLFGGNQEKALRAGTENVAAIIGFGKAAELAKSELETRIQYLRSLKESLEKELLKIQNLTIFSKEACRLPNTIQFGIDAIDGEMLVMNLDRSNIAVSSGSACANGSNEISPVLKAMNVPTNLAKSAIRISLGMSNTEEHILTFIYQLKKHINCK